MILVICLDQRGGTGFNHRRQSKDRLLRQRLLELTGDRPLWMNAYSARQFEETAPNIRVADNFADLAGEGEFCFVETLEPLGLLPGAEELIVFRWDKVYPADCRFSPETFGHLAEQEEFEGHSHACITLERYLP